MVSTIVSELSENPLTIAATKQAILWGLLVLVPCLAFTGLSGYQIAGKAPRGLMLTKFKRMRVIGINGICILVPCAFFLAFRAAELKFGWPFYGIQFLELLAGSINLVLLGMNFRDGLRMSRSR
ncbi:hypothetical protein NKW84_09450 [Acetobacter senegalensis]|uniref:hypothetical protein n=1 Tax=Acetobacter senegalensis TaxID=446692 RepID=UPI00209EBC19|nr:hypothetical protein [Acetobacter senegalensis]MCP1196084.1 hypothetical protein [Acetobacter senegalensis]